jgi:glutamate N-acetyltransferase/amino-acid N-acetyltransferase
MMKIEEKAVLPKGYKAAGIAAGLKASGKADMGMLFSESPALAAGCFTTNQVQAATVRLDRQRVETYGVAHGVVVNSGQANACTGKRGLEDAKAMAREMARCLGVAAETVLVGSTGRIGVPLRMDVVVPGIRKLAEGLSADGGEAFAQGILTTDTRAKRFTAVFTAGGKKCRLTGIAKGAGMIEPCMGTMLAFVVTDAAVANRKALQAALQAAVRKSFNRVSVDGDRSTNDTVLLLANGAAGGEAIGPKHPDWAAFTEALEGVTLRLAKAMARDGEGASKMVTVRVKGARSAAEADIAARSVANSLLVKTSWVGTFPNWGRVMDALGYSKAKVREEKVDIFYDGVQAVKGGMAAPVKAGALEKILGGKEFTVECRLGLGKGEAVVYTCDCTEEYVVINKE